MKRIQTAQALICFSLSLCGLSALGAQMQAIQVSGETSAELGFIAQAPTGSTPRLIVNDNQVELVFSGWTLSPELAKNSEITSPHALIQRIELTQETGAARAIVTVNGPSSKLRDRVKLQKTDTGIGLVVNVAEGGEATLALLKEEQAAIEAPQAAPTNAGSGWGWIRWVLALGFFAAAGVASWYFVKFAKKKGGWVGTRKHLIETIAQTPIGGGKANVAVLKIGSEFVLVGVTAQQVTLLSALPKLAEQYETENELETSSFKEAVAVEVAKGRRTLGLEA